MSNKTPRLWYVDWAHGGEAPRDYFEDEFTARTYLLLVRAAFNLKAGFNLFLGRIQYGSAVHSRDDQTHE